MLLQILVAAPQSEEEVIQGKKSKKQRNLQPSVMYLCDSLTEYEVRSTMIEHVSKIHVSNCIQTNKVSSKVFPLPTK